MDVLSIIVFSLRIVDDDNTSEEGTWRTRSPKGSPKVRASLIATLQSPLSFSDRTNPFSFKTPLPLAHDSNATMSRPLTSEGLNAMLVAINAKTTRRITQDIISTLQ